MLTGILDAKRDPYFCCFSYPLALNKTKDYPKLYGHIWELSRNGLNDKCVAFRFFGAFIIYENDMFKSTSTLWWAYGDGYETNVPAGFENKASSVIYIGDNSKDWKTDTLTVFNHNYFYHANYIMTPDTIIDTIYYYPSTMKTLMFFSIFSCG
jgi:hypothetical protein